MPFGGGWPALEGCRQLTDGAINGLRLSLIPGL